ncbi:SDR family NAD(P)-dependent oxidoreductase [Dechloromonas denitrificans]|uniref:SDR family NAD(P)-dependent oxidoreductase n=1 Tax=Dechloromonas denitrificans TaxID=281362 RepID=UPI001CFB7B5B|nr:SDR family NAD(P)-dependent oxidoreductase [Dechloromonas denitrificans]UCV09946.1 SDR family NAD(P)-dependent oxidoreductase [Dechloromonas denitrificans]
MFKNIWRHLKKDRKIQFGPLALAFKFERSVSVTRNKKAHFKYASVRHQDWINNHDETVRIELNEQMGNSSLTPAAGSELALIVGVGPGFGYALARKLAKEGIAVVLASRNAKRLDDLVSEIQSAGGFACAYGCDATSEASVVDLFTKVSATHGVPQLVVYSLQSFGPGTVMDIELPAFEEGWKHNCLGSFLVARSAARLMHRAGRGSIILVGSTSSILGRAGHLNLAVGKFGQRALAQVLARELWPAGVHVAHLLIDADIREVNTDDEAGTSSDPQQIAETVFTLHRQPKTAWSSEMDIRPWNEQFWEHC